MFGKKKSTRDLVQGGHAAEAPPPGEAPEQPKKARKEKKAKEKRAGGGRLRELLKKGATRAELEPFLHPEEGGVET